jgi:hypothetical protein
MTSDPIVDEIRQARDQHAAKYGHDLDRIFAAIKEAEKNYSSRLVNREPMTREKGSHHFANPVFPNDPTCIPSGPSNC